jgi:hypothetical protein
LIQQKKRLIVLSRGCFEAKTADFSRRCGIILVLWKEGKVTA